MLGPETVALKLRPRSCPGSALWGLPGAKGPVLATTSPLGAPSDSPQP